jgi:hypothetical protein
MTTNSELTTTQNGTGVLSPEDIALMQGDAGTNTDFKREDLAVPFLVIVQATSGYVQRDDPDFIDAARPGHILDTVNKVPRQHVLFVPCKFETTYTEWKPNRGGLVKAWGNDSSKYDSSGTDFGKRTTAEGTEIVPSATYRGLMISETGDATEVVINMNGTQFRKSRTLNALINGAEETAPDGSKFSPPMYARFYKLETVTEQNELGKWFGWKAETGGKVLSAGPAGKSIYMKAKALREQIEAGTARPTPTAAPTQGDQGEIPFD